MKKLCEKCKDESQDRLGATTEYGEEIIEVPESECEFWAHVQLRICQNELEQEKTYGGMGDDL